MKEVSVSIPVCSPSDRVERCRIACNCVLLFLEDLFPLEIRVLIVKHVRSAFDHVSWGYASFRIACDVSTCRVFDLLNALGVAGSLDAFLDHTHLNSDVFLSQLERDDSIIIMPKYISLLIFFGSPSSSNSVKMRFLNSLNVGAVRTKLESLSHRSIHQLCLSGEPCADSFPLALIEDESTISTQR